jgi:DcmR-like sensory protein
MKVGQRALAVLMYTQAARIRHMQGGYSDKAQFIEVVKSIGPHDHLCLIYSSREEQFAAIAPSLEIGVDRRERVLYIADESSAAAVGDAMRETGIDVDRHRRDGTFVIIVGKKDMYIKPGYFQPGLEHPFPRPGGG